MNYSAPWWLPGGNLQTIWAALRAQRFAGAAPVFRRERWTTPDDDFVDVDWLVDAPTLLTSCSSLPPEGAGLAWGGPAQRPDAPTLATSSLRRAAPFTTKGAGPTCDVAEGPPDAPTLTRPLLVVFHGLEGSSASHYAEALAVAARLRGWACAVPHFRTCSGEINYAPRAYHSGDFEEIDWILRRFKARHRGPLLVAGVSLGGNALMRWAGELGTGAGAVVNAIASVCSPLDLTASGEAIGKGFNRLVYTPMFLRTMVPKALEKLDQHPGLFSRDGLLRARNLYEFDDIFTAPLHGFKNAADYWSRASAKPHMHHIAVPALALNALNDPFVPPSSLPAAASVSRCVSLWRPAQGGHVGFPSAPFPGHVRVMPEAVTGFLAAHLQTRSQHG
jgi:predicted alpha/beta-fold hydrolase